MTAPRGSVDCGTAAQTVPGVNSGADTLPLPGPVCRQDGQVGRGPRPPGEGGQTRLAKGLLDRLRRQVRRADRPTGQISRRLGPHRETAETRQPER